MLNNIDEDISVHSLLFELRNTNSRAEKEEIIRQLLSIDLGRKVLYHASSPTITYGIDPRKIDIPDTEGRRTIRFRWPLVAKFLDALATRELSGKAAEAEVINMLGTFREEGRELLYSVLRKDLRAGIGISLINSVEPGFIPQFKVMRAKPYEAHRIEGKKCYAEWKLDGQRTTFLCHEGNGGFYTRSGKLVPALSHAIAPVLMVARTIAATMPDVLGKPESLSFAIDSEAIMGLFSETGKLRRKGKQAEACELHVFEVLSYDEFMGVTETPTYSVRRKRVEDFVRAGWKLLEGNEANLLQMTPRFAVNGDAEIQALFEKARKTTLASYLARGDDELEQKLLLTTIDKHTGKPQVLEGLIVKTDDGGYEPRQSFEWLKLKPEETLDLRVIGAYPGERETKYENCLGGIIVDHNGVAVNVGGGISDKEREEIWQDYIADMNAMKDRFLTVKEFVGGRLINRLAEIEFSEVTPDGSLRHPRFIRFRDDKDGEIAD